MRSACSSWRTIARCIRPSAGSCITRTPAIRRQAVRLLARGGDATVKDQIEKLVKDPDLGVRTEALLYLTEFDPMDPLQRIEALGEFEDFSIQAAVVAFLARPGRSQNIEAAKLLLSKMVEEKGAAGRRARLEAARLLSILPDAFDRELRGLVDDEDCDVAKAAIAAAGALKKRSLIGDLIDRLAEPALNQAVIAALASFGDRIVGTLRDYLTDEAMSAEVRREIPKVLEEIGSKAAQEVLVESVLDRDVVLRYHTIAALNRLGQAHPDRSTDRKLIESVLAAEIMGHYRSYQVLGTLGGVLKDAANPIEHGLRESMEKETERIFRLLKILYPQYDMHSAYVSLQSTDPIVHDNGVEFMDSVLPPEVRQLVIPLFDREVSVESRIATANRMLGSTLGDREEAIEVMALSEDPWLRACAAYAMGEMRLKRFAQQLDQWADDSDPLLRATAIDAREKLRHAATAAAGVDALWRKEKRNLPHFYEFRKNVAGLFIAVRGPRRRGSRATSGSAAPRSRRAPGAPGTAPSATPRTAAARSPSTRCRAGRSQTRAASADAPGAIR